MSKKDNSALDAALQKVKIALKLPIDNGIKFVFADSKRTTIEVSFADLSEPIIRELAYHGLKQKLGDSYSGVSDIGEAIRCVQTVVDNLKAGNFNARGSTGGLIIEAIARLTSMTVEEAQTLYNTLDNDAKELLMRKPQIVNTLAIIRGERAALKLKSLDAEDFELGI
jgi:hypothetical protein